MDEHIIGIQKSIAVILWYDKKYLFGLHLGSWHRRCPWSLLSDRDGRESFFIHNKPLLIIPGCMLMRWLVDPLDLLPGEPTMWLEGWTFQPRAPNLRQWDREWRRSSSPMANDLITYACVMEPPYKSLNGGVQRASRWVNPSGCWEDDAPGQDL